MAKPYIIKRPKTAPVPILVSVPHAGTSFPRSIKYRFIKDKISPPDDTDHYVGNLYDFVADMGITMICANYSRWVIDLNRSPDNTSLYTDGRIITALTPTSDFLGDPIYKDSKLEPTAKEVESRKELYFEPYYKKVEKILQGFKKTHGQAILWDAHSIRRTVPTIQADPFPDMILGTNDGQSASAELIAAAREGLSGDNYELKYNTPFKGGNITRHFGRPSEGIHALQLEMCKNLYMDDAEVEYHSARAEKMRAVLQRTLALLINQTQS